MFLVRFGVLAIVVVMLLPAGPQEHANPLDGEQARKASFCERYPKTCDASGELLTAFKHKLIYGVSVARSALEAQSTAPQFAGSVPPAAGKLEGRFGQWIGGEAGPADVAPLSSGALDQRSSEWRGDNN